MGAFVNEAGVSPEDIGEIDIDGDEVTVELSNEAVETVVETMDGGRIGSATVSVHRYDEEYEKRREREYVREYTRLVEMERKEEMRRDEGEAVGVAVWASEASRTLY